MEATALLLRMRSATNAATPITACSRSAIFLQTPWNDVDSNHRISLSMPKLFLNASRISFSSMASSKSWSEEWKRLGLGARPPKPGSTMTNLLFVQMGFGVDQHGNDDKAAMQQDDKDSIISSGSGGGATKADVRAIRNAIEFNSIPGVIEAVPGGRSEMLISVKLGVPPKRNARNEPMDVNLNEVAKVFPYGRLLPIEVVVGGLSFHTGRIVRELGDVDDLAVCVAACVSIGYDNGERIGERFNEKQCHKTYDTKDGV
mmetsp:Transcript_21676/g.45598  ORF Transcript_21676/g.45598 Transcript_21676/m.45598 type:complete len:259 (-) Transcript_21676:7-783(-)